MNTQSKNTIGTVLNNRYEIIDIKHGGFGEVLICKILFDKPSWLKNKNNYLVLKTIKTEFIRDENIRNRFVKEAKAWLKLNNPDFTVGIRQIEYINGIPYLVMDYCSNGSLADKIRQKRVTVDKTIIYASKILIGLWIISDGFNMVHRDLKPDNILFNDDDEPLISDLGLIKFLQDDINPNFPDIKNFSDSKKDNYLTESNFFMGTLPYASPEQIMGAKDIDVGVDIWAFGVIFIEMITGYRPFSGNSEKELVEAIFHGTAKGIESITNKVSESVARIIEKCLQKRRTDRYQTFKELINDWDSAVNFVDDIYKTWLPKTKNKYVVYDENLTVNWKVHLFPERLPKTVARLSVDISEIESLSQAINYKQLGQYEETVEMCDKVLGNINNLSSNISLLFNGKFNSQESYKKSSSEKFTIKAPVSVVLEALYLKMTTLIFMFEERENPNKYLQELVDISNRFLKSGIDNDRITDMCAQAYLLSGFYDKAEELLWNLLNKNPDNVKSWLTLFLTVERSKDIEKIRKVAKKIHSECSTKEDFFSQYVCAKVGAVLGDWKSATAFSIRAHELNPNDLDTLYICTASLINLRELELAYHFFNKMASLSPDSYYTKRIKSILLEILENET